MSRSPGALIARAWIVVIGSFGASASGAGAPSACPDYLAVPEAQCREWLGRVLPAEIPPARGNAYADRVDAAELGMRIFYDNRFSRPGTGVSCASCHDPEHAFSENKPRSRTIREASRNAPDLLDAAWYVGAHFWDGKVDTLWSAPLFTFEQDDEMGSSRLHVAHMLSDIYGRRYEKIFGPLPDLSDTRRFPESGKPGSPEFDGMSRGDQDAVNRIYANVGKSLEAYIRRLAAGRSSFDSYMGGSETSLSRAARRGMDVFGRLGCDACHSGPTFTDEKFHKLGLAPRSGGVEDAGRLAGAQFSRAWPFSSRSVFADATPVQTPSFAENTASQEGAFRTPSLRNVALTAPYGHDGTLGTLDEAIDAHAGVLKASPAMSSDEKRDLIEFLRSLNGRPPLPPWNYWPGG